MTLAMEEDESADPRDVGILGAAAVVPGAGSLADSVEESRFRCGGRAYFTDGQHGERAFRQRGIRDRMTLPRGDRAHALEASFVPGPRP
jgi:hypothetical protein